MTNEDIVLEFVDAINRHDPERISRLMTEDHLFVDTGGGEYRGRDMMRAGWKNYFSMVADYTIKAREIHEDGAVVIVIGTARGTYSPDGKLNPADRWSAPAAWRAMIKDGRVAVWQVFSDNEPLRRIMARHGQATD